MLRHPSLLVSLLAVSVVACSSSTGPTLVNTLDVNRAKWDSRGVDTYSYVIQYTCFCGAPNTPVRVEVVNGIVTARTLVANGSVVNNGSGMFGTIPELFDRLRGILGSRPARSSVTYDADFSFPDSYFVDRIGNAIDDEESALVTEFQTPLTG